MEDLRIVRAGPERIDDLEPLWKSLHAHHRTVPPALPGIPMREVDDTWPRRRAEYEEWLAEPDAFVLIAEHGEGPVGYALVHFHRPADDCWVTRERFAELESLAVLPEARGRGIGGALMREVYAELRRIGVRELVIGVLATNERALRFYEREGFRPWMVKYFGAIPTGDEPDAEPGLRPRPGEPPSR